MIVVSVIGIILAFAVLIFAAYKKISMFLAAVLAAAIVALFGGCLLYTSPSPRDLSTSRMPSSA